MHTLVQMVYLTRKEFERNFQGLTDEDARKRIEPMNCISWIIAHVACQHHAFFVDWPQGIETAPQYQHYGYGSPASQPPLEEALTMWRDACEESDAWLQAATDKNLQVKGTFTSPESENWGTLLVRCIFHTWCHLGEINSIRQILGHQPPQFVNMHDWSYESI
ncbi:MAG: DinB family protein [Promethearchaeota archaeon]